MFNIKEPVNALTHLAGALLSAAALGWMIVKGVSNGSTLQVVSAVIFGLSLIALYTASTVYHWVPSSEKLHAILRRVDHSMIYILIAGTYTPVCLIALKRNSWLDIICSRLGIGHSWYYYETCLV